MEVVRESPIIQELLTQEHQLGFEEGVEQGRRQEILETLHQILTIRFDVVSGDFDEGFEQLDLKSLKQLSEVAWTVQTLAEFEDALAEVLSQLEATPRRPDDSE